jgi:predicted nucleic acid-binding protein
VSGNNLLLDTNIIVYALKGLTNVKPYFDTDPFISVITEMEILGVKEITDNEINIREMAIEFCSIIPFTNKIKNKAIAIKRQIKIPLPDAIIAATAIEEGLTLVTADKGFKRIKDLPLILIEV